MHLLRHQKWPRGECWMIFGTKAREETQRPMGNHRAAQRGKTIGMRGELKGMREEEDKKAQKSKDRQSFPLPKRALKENVKLCSLWRRKTGN